MKDKASQTSAPSLPPGLYLVATPIGNLRDMTYRAVEVLHAAKVIACEDTRMTTRLLRHYGINTPMDTYHEHNGEKKRPLLIERALNEPVALVSDAGTPLISDPGYKLVREAVARGVHVESLPGASSVLAGLCISGLPSNRFMFAGFLPPKEAAAKEILRELAGIDTTLIFFESAKRLCRCLRTMNEMLGEQREAAVVRELTKLHEEARRGTLAELVKHYNEHGEPKGEIVIVVGPPQKGEAAPNEQELEHLLRRALRHGSVKDAVKEISDAYRLPHREVYQLALRIKDADS